MESPEKTDYQEPLSSPLIIKRDLSPIFMIARSDPKRSSDNLQKSMKIHIKDEIWEIPNFLKPEECENLIELTDKLGYINAARKISENSMLRDLKRIMIRDEKSAEILSQWLEPLVPLCYEGGIFIGLHENFRFYKYEKSNKYNPHIDGELENIKNNTKSVASLIIYLNGLEEEGKTRFHLPGSYEYLDIKPEIGKLLIYRQKGWLHEGLACWKELKYIIRIDLMYRWLDNDEIKTFPKQKCKLCNQEFKEISLSCCEHFFLECNCKSFSESNMMNSHYIVKCRICNKEVQTKKIEEKKICRLF